MELKTLFSKIRDPKYSHILLMGDFNMKEISWLICQQQLARIISHIYFWKRFEIAFSINTL